LHDEGAIDRIRNIKSPETHMKLLEAYVQLAGNYFREGGIIEAVSTYEKALTLLQLTGITNMPALAVTVLGALGVLARRSDQLEKAQWCFSEMIAAGQLVAQLVSRDSTSLGLSSSNTITEFAVYTVHCADLLRVTGEFCKASALLEDACDVLNANVGPDHIVSQAARRCLLLAELGAMHVVAEFVGLSPDLLYANNASRAAIANVPALETSDPAYVHKEATLQQISAVLATHPKKLAASGEQDSTESKEGGHSRRNYLHWRHRFYEIVDLNALRAKCCHLLDPLCAIAVTIFSTDSQLQTVIYRGKSEDSTFFTNFHSKGLAPELVYPVLSSCAPALGAGPTDTDWPDVFDAAGPVEAGVMMNVDDPNVISLDAMSNGSTLFRSMTEANNFLPVQYDRTGLRNFASNTDFLGNRVAFSLPIFALKKSSLQRGGDSQNEFGAVASPICIDVNIRNGGNETDRSIRDAGKQAKNEVAWTLSLPENTLVKLATSGEWISYQLTDKVEKPRSLWMRASILHIGNLIDRFTQLWAVHAQWAAHHIMATAALEELICDSIMEGTELTRKAPGGGLQTFELDGYDVKPQRGLFPAHPSGNEAVRLISRKAPMVQPPAAFSHEAPQSSVLSDDFGDTTEHERSLLHEFDQDHGRVDSRVEELEFVLSTSRHTYAACQKDLIRSQSGLRRCMRQWEFDSRRQRSMMGRAGDEESVLPRPRVTTESLLSRRLSEISANVYEMLSEASIGSRDISKKNSGNRMIIGISSWEDIRSALWDRTEVPLMACLELMCEATGLQMQYGTFTDAVQESEENHLNVRNIARVACQVALYSAVDKIVTFHWQNWRKKASTWNSFISHKELNAIVDECETIMYAPVPRSFLQQATPGVVQEAGSERNMNFATQNFPESEADVRAKAQARQSALDALPPVRFHTRSPALRLMQKAIQAHVHALSSPRSNLQLRMQGATESCAQQ